MKDLSLVYSNINFGIKIIIYLKILFLALDSLMFNIFLNLFYLMKMLNILFKFIKTYRKLRDILNEIKAFKS